MLYFKLQDQLINEINNQAIETKAKQKRLERTDTIKAVVIGMISSMALYAFIMVMNFIMYA